MVADIDRLSTAARRTLSQLSAAYWPGPLTLVLPAQRGMGLSTLVIPQGEVAVRFTSSPIAAKLARQHGFPIVSTSANQAGQPECRSVRAIERAFPADGLTPDLIINGGALPRRKPSTIVRICPDGSLETLRQGAVRPTLPA
jgi:L-threonylcarbamoyladenylate synthase